MQKGMLHSNRGSMDFLARLSDSIILWGTCVLTHQLLDLEWSNKSNILTVLSIVCFQLSGSVLGVYLSWRSQTVGPLLQRLLLAVFFTFVLLAVAAWSSRQPHFITSRVLLLQWGAMCLLCMTAFRLSVRRILIELRMKGRNVRRAAVIGSGPLGHSLIEVFQGNVWMGISIVGLFDNESNEADRSVCAGDISAAVQLARDGELDNVYIALPLSRSEQIGEIVDALMDTTVSVYLVPDIFAFTLLNARQESVGGLPIISLVDSPLNMLESILKRVFDVVISSLILLVIGIPMIFIAVAVRCTSSGPAVFKQFRYGVDGKPITVWKFRSMYTQDNGLSVEQAQKNDPRITPLGAFLRRTSLDELPQFINVLQGQMSIVGPRPHAVAHNEYYRGKIKGYMMRHKVKPGITGWAQVNGYRGETETLEKMEKRVEYDLHYIRNWSLWLDAKIIAMTFIGGFTGKNAY